MALSQLLFLPHIDSNEFQRRLGGLNAIDELIDVKTGGDDNLKTMRLSQVGWGCLITPRLSLRAVH